MKDSDQTAYKKKEKFNNKSELVAYQTHFFLKIMNFSKTFLVLFAIIVLIAGSMIGKSNSL